MPDQAGNHAFHGLPSPMGQPLERWLRPLRMTNTMSSLWSGERGHALGTGRGMTPAHAAAVGAKN